MREKGKWVVKGQYSVGGGIASAWPQFGYLDRKGQCAGPLDASRLYYQLECEDGVVWQTLFKCELSSRCAEPLCCFPLTLKIQKSICFEPRFSDEEP